MQEGETDKCGCWEGRWEGGVEDRERGGLAEKGAQEEAKSDEGLSEDLVIGVGEEGTGRSRDDGSVIVIQKWFWYSSEKLIFKLILAVQIRNIKIPISKYKM